MLGSFSADAFHDVLVTMHSSRSTDVSSTVLVGDIHCVRAESFIVHVYKEKMLRKFKRNPIPIHTDTTVTLVRNVGGNSFFLCYAVIAEDKEKSFPKGVMMSNAHYGYYHLFPQPSL